MIGFDFGIKPKIMIIGDYEYLELIHEGKPIAMLYGQTSYFRLLNEPFYVAIVFENEEKGRECFQHFKKWTDASSGYDAVSLSFIEPKTGGYIVCVYPEFESLIERCVPKYQRSEINPQILTPIRFH